MRDLVPESDYYYTNKMGRMLLIALEEIMGRNDLNAILNLTNMREFIKEFPPDNLKREFNFSHVANLTLALEELYGERKARSLLLRCGRAMFARGLSQFGQLAGVGDLAFKVLPLSAKLKIGVPAIALIFSQYSDQKSHVEEKDDAIYYYIDRCSMCWGRQEEHPLGFTAVGILQEALRWVSGGLEFRIQEIECVCMGAEQGVFKIDKEPIR